MTGYAILPSIYRISIEIIKICGCPDNKNCDRQGNNMRENFYLISTVYNSQNWHGIWDIYGNLCHRLQDSQNTPID